jgi:hypothetical protein
VGKWLARLGALDHAEQDENSAPPFPPHCQNRQNPVSSVLAVGREGGSAGISEACDASALLPHAGGWGRADMGRFLARRARLQRWGWPADEAEALADRLTRRDLAGDDDRVSCTDCTHYRPGRCRNHRRAGLYSAELGRDLAGLLQRCPGFQSEG